MELFGIAIPDFFKTDAARKAQPSAVRDWLIVLIAFIVLLIILIVWSTYFFFTVRSGDAGSDAPSLPAATPFSRAQLHAMREAYDAKAQAWNAGSAPAGLQDPSR